MPPKDFFSSFLSLLNEYSSELSSLASLIAIVVIFVTPLRAIPTFIYRMIYRSFQIVYLGASEKKGVVDAIADPATWAAKQTEFLNKHQGQLLVITRSSPFAHVSDTYRNRLEDIQKKIEIGEIDKAKYIISIQHMLNLYRAGFWEKARVIARLRSLIDFLDPSSAECIDINTVEVCDADFYFTYGLQIYDSRQPKKSFLIFYIEQSDGQYGPSFVVKKHPELVSHQRQYFQSWFNTLSGKMIEEYKSGNVRNDLIKEPRTRLLRLALVSRLKKAIEMIEE